MHRFLPLALMVLAAGTPAIAQDGYRHGRIGYLEPGVTLQRATEAGSEEATPNVPFLPGDRVWTDDAGRVEFQFLDGTFVRLDRRSKLDYTAHEEGRAERIILRLWSGSLYLRSRNSDNLLFGIETPGGLVLTQERGVYRVDVDSGETRLSVHEGEATLEAGRRRVTVGAGERSYARGGDNPERPRPFDRGEADEFARWERDRTSREAWAGNSRRYLPKELDPYAGDFEAHGSWYYETEVGYVWRPYVGAGWRPYSFGRWVWTAYGWTWVPNETWGWAPAHYGRWGHSLGLGWYWIPGNVWGPAWVSWGLGGDYVGWCPLGYRDRPVVVAETRPRGYAVPRGSPNTEMGAWTFARRGDMGLRDLARRRVDPAVVKDVRIMEQPRARPTRDLRLVEGEAAVPRNIRTRPTVGDTVPELKTDNTTHIPAPVVRGHPGPVTQEDMPPLSILPPGDGRARYDQRPGESARPREQEARRNDSGRPGDRDRDVLRPMFQPLSEPHPRSGEEGARPRDEGGSHKGDEGASRARGEGSSHPSSEGSAARGEPRSTPRPRSEPTRAPQSPRPEPPRPKKDKN